MAEEVLSRNEDLLNRAEEDLHLAKSQLSNPATEEQMESLRAAEAAYGEAVSKYREELEYVQELAQEQSSGSDSAITVNGGNMRINDHLTGRWDPDEWGPRFVVVTKDSNGVTMSGTEEDAHHARSLRSKIPGDFIWFERDEKSYIIRDQATVERAKALWKPQEELGKKQEELGKQQEALGKQQEALGEKMEQVRVKIPDLTAQMQKLEAEMKQLSANGGTMEQVGDLQSEIGDLQRQIGEIQGEAGRQQGEIGRQQGELGRKQGELGRQQGELGRQQGELARQANQQMKQLLEDALAKGLAQPEESLR